MAENKDVQSPTPKDQKTSARHRKQSVFQYLAILFAAAFFLLGYTFMMERRQFEIQQQENMEQIDNLEQDSVNAINSINKLYAQNEKLKEEKDDLQEQLTQAQQALAQLQTENQTLRGNWDSLAQSNSSQKKSLEAMDWFWQIDEAYVRGRNERCKDLILSMMNAGLVEYLPKESITDNGRFSPYDRYQEIYADIHSGK